MVQNFYTADTLIPERSIGFLIKRIHKLGTSQVEAAFENLELSHSQWSALMLIRHKIADNSAQLARCLGHDSGATTRLVDQLEDRGFLRRFRGTQDRRVINVELAPGGEVALGVTTAQMATLWNEVLDDFTTEEVQMMVSLLGRLLATLEAREDGGKEA